MKVRYRCHVCKTDRTIDVPDRAVAVDIRLWMEQVSRLAGIDHINATRSQCASRVVDLMIPVDESATHIGAASSKDPSEMKHWPGDAEETTTDAKD